MVEQEIQYKVIKMDEGERHFTGDYEDKFEIEFQTIPSDELFDKIDEMLASGNKKKQKDPESRNDLRKGWRCSEARQQDL